METEAPFKEIIEEIKELGEDAVKFCYQLRTAGWA